MRKIILGLTILAIAATSVFVACKKGDEKKESQTKQPVQTLMKDVPHKAVIKGSTVIPMTDSGLLGCLSCYQGWISNWISTLSPEALKVVFEDFPFLNGYIINFGQKVGGYDVSVLMVRNTETGEDFSLIRKTKGALDENNKLTGEFVLAEMNGTEILHNTYVAGIRTIEINHLDEWVENPSVMPCAAPAGADKYFGHCTRAQFNAAYNRAKNECESDWQCDFLCSFHPCKIVYIASAMMDCW
jgi:hypothetical protein